MKVFLYRFIQKDEKSFFAKVLKGFLRALSFLYIGLSRAICFLYQHRLLKRSVLLRPVISIGNLTLGGTGKTPLAGFIASHLKAKGYDPVILIRGYMAHQGISDEVELYKSLLPHVHIEQGKDRFRAGLRAFKNHPSVDAFILDDGFQHWALERDLDIVVIDATDPFGNGACLPRGILREPVSALKRADVIIMTKVDLAKEGLLPIYTVLRKNNFHAIFAEAIYEPIKLVNVKNGGQDQEVSSLKDRDVFLFSAIGNTDAFEGTVHVLGANVKKTFSFLDHHLYTKKDLAHIIKEAQRQKVTTLVTTQKDAVKLQDLVGICPKDMDVFALAVSLKIIKGEKEFEDRIHAVLQR